MERRPWPTGGRLRSSARVHEEALSIRRELGDQRGSPSRWGTWAWWLSTRGTTTGRAASSSRCWRFPANWVSRSDRIRAANALNHLGIVAGEQGESAAARRYFEEALTLSRKLGDESNAANTLVNLGLIANAQGDPVTARTRYEEALLTFRSLGDKRCVALVLIHLSSRAREQGNWKRRGTISRNA